MSLAKARTIVALAIGISLLMSTQFLAQPFVWRNWPIDDVLTGWIRIAGDRVIVAAAISASVVTGLALTRRSAPATPWVIAAAILLGSIAGEYGRFAIDPYGDHMDRWSRAGRIAQWALVAAWLSATIHLWRVAAASAAAGDDAQLRQARNRSATTQAELEALRWQIEPHFLFNTLATIQRLGRTAPVQGLHLLSRLFDFITANLTADEGDLSTIGAELDLASAYLDVCQARMGRRLSVDWDIDPALRSHPFPRYMLGTLVENAIKHGISPKAQEGRIAIVVAQAGQQIAVIVSDTGDGLIAQGGSGTGLANLIARLRLRYADGADFALRPAALGGMSAIVRVPLELDFAND